MYSNADRRLDRIILSGLTLMLAALPLAALPLAALPLAALGAGFRRWIRDRLTRVGSAAHRAYLPHGCGRGADAGRDTMPWRDGVGSVEESLKILTSKLRGCGRCSRTSTPLA